MTKQPKFKAKIGQVDFTDIRWAPVINCVLKFKNKYLVIQRSADMNFYPSYWNGVSGFLDDNKSLEQKVFDELGEELGIKKEQVNRVKLAEIFDQDEPKYNKTWIVHPVLVEVNTDKITLDWEGRDFRWLTMDEIMKLDLLPGFDKVLEKIKMLE